MTNDVAALLCGVQLLVLDVDGVLTDGVLYYGADGEALKAFHVHDGLGIKLLQGQGVQVAVISAKRSAPLERRLAELGVVARLGRHDKLTALHELVGELGLGPDAIAYVGDDWIDLPVMAAVRVAIAVPNARPQVIAAAHWTTTAGGGRGAVREIAEAILEARGELEAALSRVMAPA